MRNVLLTIAGAVSLISDSPAAAPARLTVSIASVTSLTGDVVVTSALAESLSRRVLRLDAFASGSRPTPGGQGLTGGYFELASPIRVVERESSTAADLDLHLELEQASYGPVVDPKSDILAFWAFGLFGLTSWRDASAAVVQWRCTAFDRQSNGLLVVVGEGAAVGDRRSLGRRDAMLLANRRALYDLAYELTVKVNAVYGFELRRKWLKVREDEMRSRIDSW